MTTTTTTMRRHSWSSQWKILPFGSTQTTTARYLIKFIPFQSFLFPLILSKREFATHRFSSVILFSSRLCPSRKAHISLCLPLRRRLLSITFVSICTQHIYHLRLNRNSLYFISTNSFSLFQYLNEIQLRRHKMVGARLTRNRPHRHLLNGFRFHSTNATTKW